MIPEQSPGNDYHCCLLVIKQTPQCERCSIAGRWVSDFCSTRARADPRRKAASLGVYSHKRDGWGIFYDQPVLLNERQAGVSLEGMVRQTAVEDPGCPAQADGIDGWVFSSLSLLSNSAMAWNAGHMQNALNRIQATGENPLFEDLRRIAPINIEGINLRGTFDFPVEKFAQRILPSSVPVKALNQRRTA